MNADVRQRYTAVAIVLHWMIALAIFAMIPLGWWMSDAIDAPATQAKAAAAFQLHKTIGLTVLGLSIARLLWRLAHPAPPMPAHMPAWQRSFAYATHWGFYALMVGMPLSGYLYVSTGWSAPHDRPLEVPTLYLNRFEVPHLALLHELSAPTRALAAQILEFIHSKLAWVAIVLAALHAGAALKHHFFDQDDVLVRMVPGLKPLAPTPPAGLPEPGRRIILVGGLALMLILGGGGLLTFNSLPGPVIPGAAPAAPERAAEPQPEPVQEAGGAAEAPDASEPVAAEAAPPAPAAAAAPAPAAVASGAAPVWTVEREASSISFSGTHAGTAFAGTFGEWRAEIRFDLDNLAASSAVVTVETGSARDGVPLHEQSLPEPEWFDVEAHPQAVFRTSRFRALGDGRYEADGALTLKGREIALTLPFQLSIRGERAVMEGRVAIDRGAADLGQTSDPDGDWVSQSIDVRVRVEAVRAP